MSSSVRTSIVTVAGAAMAVTLLCAAPSSAQGSDGRLVAFRGPGEATVFRLDKPAGSTGDLVREGDAFALGELRTGRLGRADRPPVALGPSADTGAIRFASLLVPGPGGKL